MGADANGRKATQIEDLQSRIALLVRSGYTGLALLSSEEDRCTDTANAIDTLPPELLRKGRFDEIFFVDLPTAAERAEIFAIHLRKRRRHPEAFAVAALVKASEGFSGAEIEAAIVAAMYHAFPADREFTTADVTKALGETVPLSETMEEKVQALRAWARPRARWATAGERS